jgi:hypothetical protein
MKKLGYVFAAFATIVVAAPSIASAETVVIRRGDHHHWGPHAELRGHRWDRGWHHHHDRVVVVKKHRYD